MNPDDYDIIVSESNLKDLQNLHDYKQQLQRSQDCIHQLKQSLIELDQEIKRRQDLIQFFEEKEKNSTLEIQSLHEQNEGLLIQRQNLIIEVSDMKEKQEQLNKKIGKLEELVMKLNRNMIENDEICKDLVNKNDMINSKYEEDMKRSGKETKELNEKIFQLKEMMIRKDAEIKRIIDEKMEISEKMMKMENMKIGFEKEIIANKEMERRHFEEKRIVIEQQRTMAEKTATQQEILKKKAEEKLSMSMEKTAMIKKEQEEKIFNLEKQIETMKKEMSRKEKDHEDQTMSCKKEMNSMQQSLMNMKKENEMLGSLNHQKQEFVQNLQQIISSGEQKILNFSSEKEFLLNEIASLKNKIHEMQLQDNKEDMNIALKQMVEDIDGRIEVLGIQPVPPAQKWIFNCYLNDLAEFKEKIAMLITE